MYKKTSNPLYANVPTGTKYKNKELAAQNEPTYYNAVPNTVAQPSQSIYSNVNYNAKSNNIYSNIAETRKPAYKNTQYPVYDNLKPLGMFYCYYIIFIPILNIYLYYYCYYHFIIKAYNLYLYLLKILKYEK